MPSDKQVAANRRNAQKSTGPRSAEGKAASSRNALKTGIDAKAFLMGDENPEALHLLSTEYYERFCPVTPEERHFVDTLVRDEWLTRRLHQVESETWDYDRISNHYLDKVNPNGNTWIRIESYLM